MDEDMLAKGDLVWIFIEKEESKIGRFKFKILF